MDRVAPAPAAGPPAAPGDADAARAYVLNRQVREALRQRCDKGYHEAISRLTLQPGEGRTTVVCARRADRSVMADVLIGALRAALAEAGLPTEVEVVVQDAAPAVPRQPWASSRGGLQ